MKACYNHTSIKQNIGQMSGGKLCVNWRKNKSLTCRFSELQCCSHAVWWCGDAAAVPACRPLAGWRCSYHEGTILAGHTHTHTHTNRAQEALMLLSTNLIKKPLSEVLALQTGLTLQLQIVIAVLFTGSLCFIIQFPDSRDKTPPVPSL